MAKEWSVYKEFEAARELSQQQLDKTLKEAPNTRIVDTRWVVTQKDSGFKSRLVVIGCQEPRYAVRTDSPTGSHLMIMLTLAFAAQPGWRLRALDARSAYLQSDKIDRLLLLRMPHAHPPPGCLPSQIMVALGSIYGTRDAGRGFYLHAKRFLARLGLRELCLEKASYVLPGPSGPIMVIHTHVDDFFIADDGSAEADRIVQEISSYLHMKLSDAAAFTYRGLHIRVGSASFEVSQPIAACAIDPLSVKGPPERQLTEEEQSEYCSLVGRLQWLQTQSRPDLSCGTSLAARHGKTALVSHARALNQTARAAVEGVRLQAGHQARPGHGEGPVCRRLW